MIRAILSVALFLCASAALYAQTLPPQSIPTFKHPVCTRDALIAATDSYVAAQKAGNLSKMSLTADATFLENMSPIAKDKGLWNTPLNIAFTQSFHDSSRCKTFTEIVVTDKSHPYVIGTRLTVNKDGKVTEIDSLVTDKDDWLFNADNYYKHASTENWGVLPNYMRSSQQHLIDAGNQYLDLFSDKLIDAPWGEPCARTEGGIYTDEKGDPKASCTVGIPDGVLYIVNRSYVVDDEKGVVNIFCRFGDSRNGMPDSHTFRLENGRFRWIHTLSVNLTGKPINLDPAPKAKQ